MSQGYQVGIPQRLWTADAVPAVGWKITTYVANSTTPLTTYSNPTLMSANTNPIVTDADGFFRCYVAAGVLIKFSVTDENDVPQSAYSFDNLEPMVDPSVPDPSVTAVPTGGGCPWFGTGAAPTGFLLCDGSLVSRATYAALFTAIGTTYGAGDGMTTFALPDTVGRMLIGKAASGTASTLGETGGAIDHTHLETAHTHPVTVPKTWTTTGSPVAPPTDGVLSVGNSGGAGQFSSQYQPTADLSLTSGSGGAVTSGASNPPFLTIRWLIKT
jgi:microcystin-dependent protein